MPQSKINVPVRGLNYLLTFGKHKGLTIGQVIYREPSYIEWCINERIFVLDDEADEALLNSSDDEWEPDKQDFDMD